MLDCSTLCKMLVPVFPKELSVFPQPATNPVWPERENEKDSAKGRWMKRYIYAFMQRKCVQGKINVKEKEVYLLKNRFAKRKGDEMGEIDDQESGRKNAQNDMRRILTREWYVSRRKADGYDVILNSLEDVILSIYLLNWLGFPPNTVVQKK